MARVGSVTTPADARGLTRIKVRRPPAASLCELATLALLSRAPRVHPVMPDSHPRQTPGPSPGASPWLLGGLLRSDTPSLLAAAAAFKRAEGARPLRDKHVAVLCEQAHDPSAEVFTAAAIALGAAVVRIRPSMLRLDARQWRRDTARALGRLYGAIDCDGMDDSLVEQLARWSGVPVFNALAAPSHPSWILAAELTSREQGRPAAAGDGAAGQSPQWREQQLANHRFIVQALLAHCIA